jgi:hypothetical protein
VKTVKMTAKLVPTRVPSHPDPGQPLPDHPVPGPDDPGR